MREVLFRGKTENDVWVEGFYIESEYHNDRNLYRIVEKDNWCDEYEGYYYNEYDVIPETVGQFTGRTDRNKKKIFEGDIVQAALDGRYYSVEYITDDEYAFNFVDLEKGYTYSLYDFDDVVVVGNIHDNPELISGDGNAD